MLSLHILNKKDGKWIPILYSRSSLWNEEDILTTLGSYTLIMVKHDWQIMLVLRPALFIVLWNSLQRIICYLLDYLIAWILPCISTPVTSYWILHCLLYQKMRIYLPVNRVHCFAHLTFFFFFFKKNHLISVLKWWYWKQHRCNMIVVTHAHVLLHNRWLYCILDLDNPWIIELAQSELSLEMLILRIIFVITCY